MAGDNIPIDFLADHLESFEVGVKFVPGCGYLGIIRFNDKEVFRSGSFKPDAQVAFDHAAQFLEEKYLDIMNEKGIA